jgi:hypothetical protein
MEPKTFETSDLYLASALKTNGFRLVDTRKCINGRGIFVFEDRPNRPTFVKNYFNGELQGSLKNFANAWSDLKTSLNELD